MLRDVVEEGGETTEVLGHTLKILQKQRVPRPLGFRSSLFGGLWTVALKNQLHELGVPKQEPWKFERKKGTNRPKSVQAIHEHIHKNTNMYKHVVSNNYRNIWSLASGSRWVNSLNMG